MKRVYAGIALCILAALLMTGCGNVGNNNETTAPVSSRATTAPTTSAPASSTPSTSAPAQSVPGGESESTGSAGGSALPGGTMEPGGTTGSDRSRSNSGVGNAGQGNGMY